MDTSLQFCGVSATRPTRLAALAGRRPRGLGDNLLDVAWTDGVPRLVAPALRLGTLLEIG
jgi:hypothetical protein